VFHSQHEIEKYLDEIFKERGFFLEIGCWQGELISQSAYLEREKGWSGLCVDPFPVSFEARTCRVCDKAISKDGLPRAFIKVSIDRRYGGDVSYFSGFRENVEEHWNLIYQWCDYEEITIPTITMENLYDVYDLPKHIEFLSVDVEGAELEIFQSIDFGRWSYGMIDFEHNGNAKTRKAIGSILSSAGYVPLVELYVDDIWVKK